MMKRDTDHTFQRMEALQVVNLVTGAITQRELLGKARDGNRTHDLLFTKELHCQLCYTGEKCAKQEKKLEREERW